MPGVGGLRTIHWQSQEADLTELETNFKSKLHSMTDSQTLLNKEYESKRLEADALAQELTELR